MKKITLAVLATLGMASLGAHALDYYVVIPSPGKKAPAPSITAALNTATLPAGAVGEAYSYDLKQLLLVTGDPALNLSQSTWQATSALPAGLSLSSNGVISGTPTQASSGTNFTVRATYKTANAQQSYTISVQIPISVQLSSATLPGATVGTAYTYDLKQLLQVSGDSAVNLSQSSWQALSALPAGLTLGSNGVLSGTPTEASSGTSFTVRATYKTAEAQQSYTVAVTVPISISLSSTALTAATKNSAYSFDLKQRLTITGDSAPTPSQSTWEAVSSLPTGITLSSAGVLSGTPTVVGSSTISVEATYKSKTAQQTYSFNVGNVAPTLDYIARGTLQADKRTVYVPSSAYPDAQSNTCRSSGKYYWEATSNDSTGLYTGVGLSYVDTAQLANRKWVVRYYYGGKISLGPNAYASGLADPGQKQGTYGVAVDADAKTVQFYWQGAAVGTPVNYSSVASTVCPYVGIQSLSSASGSIIINLGQEPMKYTVPAGYTAGW